MAARRLPLLLALALLLASSSSADGEINSTWNPRKVSVRVYYEALCPSSANFIVNVLPKIFEKDLISIVDLSLVPWGNAKLRSLDSFTCQHGPEECILNTVEACTIHAWPRPEQHFPLIQCIESLVSEGRHSQWQSCYEKFGLDEKPIISCYTSGLGRELELEHAADTGSLQPPHKFVPWVVVDGKPLYQDYENLDRYICNAYGYWSAAAPRACLELNTVVPGRAVNLIAPVCNREETSILERWIRWIINWWTGESNMEDSG